MSFKSDNVSSMKLYLEQTAAWVALNLLLLVKSF